jgi:hypothetical protein
MLLFLMLAVAVLTITMLGVASNYKRSVLRDREVEMIHRGEQYERAVRRFYVKNGRYPVSLEQLENTNKVRYLRKRYKDPMTPDGQWKIVHPTDVKLTNLTAQGASVTGTQNSGSGLNSNALSSDTTDQTPLGTKGLSTPNTGTSSNSNDANSGNSATTSGTATTGTDSGASTTTTTNTATGSNTTSQSSSVFGSSGSNAANGQVLGGGDVYGVVSKSKKEGIHSFGDKSKYSEWFFIYVPALDKGQLLVGPYNPKAFAGTTGTGTNSTTGSSGTTNGTSGTQGSAFGTNNSSSSGSTTTQTSTPTTQ